VAARQWEDNSRVETPPDVAATEKNISRAPAQDLFPLNSHLANCFASCVQAVDYSCVNPVLSSCLC